LSQGVGSKPTHPTNPSSKKPTSKRRMKRPPSSEWVAARSYSLGRPGRDLMRGWAAAVGRIGWRDFQ
jgi:hypothetical protein